MELSKEYLKYSKEEYSYDTIEQECFRDGATAYANSVERLLKDTLKEAEKDYCIDEIDDAKKTSKISLLEDLLTDLQTLKP